MTPEQFAQAYLECEGRIKSVLLKEKIYDEDLLHDTYIALYDSEKEIRTEQFVTYFVAWYKQLYFRRALRDSHYVNYGVNAAEHHDCADESDLEQREQTAQRVDDIIDRYCAHSPHGAKNHERACKVLLLYRQGRTERQIAEELGLAKTTVHQYIEGIIRQIRREYDQRGVRYIDTPLKGCCY